MSHTITVRLTKRQAEWLDEMAERTGVPRSRIVREQLERAIASSDQPFMRLAGAVKGPSELSRRKGFSTS